MVEKRIFIAIVAFILAAWALCQNGTVEEIVVNGNKNITTDAILAQMRTKAGQPLNSAQLDKDKDSILAMGFFEAVDIRVKPITETTNQVVVEVSEFPVIKEIRVTGNKQFPAEAIIKATGLETGKVFNLNTARPAAEAIRKLYQDKGFFATVDPYGPMAESPNTLQIGIIELVVNNVTVEGNVKTKPRVMKRLIKTRPGDAFNARNWEDDLRRVNNTQWFEEVRSKETMSDEGVGLVDLTTIVKEARTGQFNIGLQVDPSSGLAGFLKLGETNLNGTGQAVDFTIMKSVSSSSNLSKTNTSSSDDPSIDISYTNPFIDRFDTSMTVQAYSRLLYRFSGTNFGGARTDTEVERYAERRTGGYLGFTRPFKKNTFFTIGTRFETIKTDSPVSSTTNDYLQQDGQLAVLTLATTVNRRDVDLDPSRGDWFRIMVEPGYSDITKIGGLFNDPGLLGSNFFTRGTLEYRYYWTNQPPRGRKLDDPRRVLAMRAKFGAIAGDVPFFEQFFVGGSDTVRGYDDDRFWGKYSFLTSVEYRVPIQKAFNFVAFVDYGGAWGGYGAIKNYTQSDSWNLHLGYGVGFSFRTPFGPIRLDFGFNDKGKSRSHFMIGTSF